MHDKRTQLIKKLEVLIEDTKWSDIVDLSPEDAKDILAILKEQDYTEKAVDIGYLYDWYQTSVTDDPPVWTDEHIKELFGDFYCIPKPKESEDNNQSSNY